MLFLYVGVGGMSELVVPTYYVGRQAHLCESRRVVLGQNEFSKASRYMDYHSPLYLLPMRAIKR